MNTSERAAADVNGDEQSGKYLTFYLAEEEYGIEILRVREIIGMMKITAVPRTPEYIRGVLNLRGKVIPVVDLRLKFGMEATEQTEETCIIVVETEDSERGIIVDKVSEVLAIPVDAAKPPPYFGEEVDTSYIRGIGAGARPGDRSHRDGARSLRGQGQDRRPQAGRSHPRRGDAPHGWHHLPAEAHAPLPYPGDHRLLSDARGRNSRSRGAGCRRGRGHVQAGHGLQCRGYVDRSGRQDQGGRPGESGAPVCQEERADYSACAPP
jgi:purine-binding chemotaxis protein CheW